MSQLTSRGLDNTSSAFVSDTYIQMIDIHIYTGACIRCMYKARFEKFPKIPKLVNWPIKVIIVNISKTIKDRIKILTVY